MRTSFLVSLLIAVIALPAIAQTCPTHAPDFQLFDISGATSQCDLNWQFPYQDAPCVPGETLTFFVYARIGGQPLEACDTVRWHFGDGTLDQQVTGPNKKLTHSYAKGGYYNFSVTISNAKGSYTDQFTLDVADAVSFAVPTLNVNENDGVAHVALTRTMGSTASLTVTCYTNDVTAKEGVRYQHTNHSVTFAAGQSTATFDVPLIDDNIFLGTQSFLVGMLAPAHGTNAVVGTQDRTSVVIADDESSPVLSFSAPAYTAAENSGHATITVNRAGLKTQPVSVHFATRDTNNPPAVTPANGTLDFASNEVSKSFNVPLIDNDLPSGDHQIAIDLTAPTGGASLSGGVTTLTAALKITDDDPRPSVSVDDISLSEGDSGQKNATFHLTLTPPVKGPTPVDYAFGEETARQSQDFAGSSGTINFAPGETSKSLNVSITGDTAAEPDETFHVTISSTLANVTKNRGVCTIVNDDAGLSPASIEMSRGGKKTLTIKLPQPAGASTSIPLDSSADGIATVPNHVTINAGASSVSFTLAAVAAGRATIHAILPDSLGGRTLSANVTVNETPSVSFDPEALTVAPNATASETLSVDPALTSSVTVTLTIDDPAVASVPPFVTIPAGGNASIPISGLRAGSATLTAALPAANGGATDTLAITVADTPLITSISPATGPSSGGTAVTIHGTNFSAACTVSFGTHPAASTELVDGSTLTAITPPHEPGATSVTVSCGGVTATATDAFTFVPGRRRPAR